MSGLSVTRYVHNSTCKPARTNPHVQTRTSRWRDRAKRTFDDNGCLTVSSVRRQVVIVRKKSEIQGNKVSGEGEVGEEMTRKKEEES